MESEGPEKEVIHLGRVWDRRPAVDEVWIVIFDLTEIDGRAECVGMSVRSYDEGLPWMPETDEEALEDAKRTGLLSPQPLRTTTLRGLPFASLLASAVRENVAFSRAIRPNLDLILPAPVSKKTGLPVFMEERLAEMRAEDDAITRAMEQKPTKPGRPRKYTRAYLENVARIYREAYLEGPGTPHPTEAVRKALGFRRKSNIPSKLVRLCRKELLLGPTERGIAGGVTVDVSGAGALQITGSAQAITVPAQPVTERQATEAPAATIPGKPGEQPAAPAEETPRDDS